MCGLIIILLALLYFGLFVLSFSCRSVWFDRCGLRFVFVVIDLLRVACSGGVCCDYGITI